MNELQIFNNKEFGEIRTTSISGEPYLMLSDVCEILGIKNVSDTKHRLNLKGVATTDTLTNGGLQKATFINESNLYKLVFQSRKPEAEKFSDWVTEEVIPSIRKHGGYLTTDKIEEVLNDPDTIIKLAMTLKEEKAKRSAAEALLEANKPKVLFADSVVASNKSMLIGELAKIIKQNGYEIGQKRLFEWLRSNGFLCKMGESYNLPTQYAMERKLFEIKKSTVNAPNGNVIVTNTVKVTPHGQIYFVNKFLKEAV